ncbi:MAG TPA: hypothetical protein VH253_09395 [Phycisphaerae bacterium]|nr:hypothetical protein [Phycisphaerae bacterium]
MYPISGIALLVCVNGRLCFSETPSSPVTWSQALHSVAKKLDLRFSLEFRVKEEETTNPLANPIIIPDTIQTKDDLMEFLRTSLPTADILVDQDAPRFIHIVEKGLSNDGNYSLNKKATLDVKGQLGNFIQMVTQKSQGAINFDTSSSLSNPVFIDKIPAAAVHAKDISYRSILSLAVEPDVEDALAWSAERLIIKGKVDEVWVHYNSLPKTGH